MLLRYHAARVNCASTNAQYRWSKLAASWIRLAIRIERIKPGHPEQNGRRERIHLTLKKEATKPAAPNFLKQQARFDDFKECYDQGRPHQALDMKYPVRLYRHSPPPYLGLGELEYPFHDRTVTVTHCGRICLGKRKINSARSSPIRTWDLCKRNAPINLAGGRDSNPR